MNYYLDLAGRLSASPGTCLRKLYGAVIVKNDEDLHRLCGGARGRENCSDLGYCLRMRLGISGGGMSYACSVHAELTPSSAPPPDMIGATLHLVGRKCPQGDMENAICCPCKRMVINAGIEQVIVRDDRAYWVIKWRMDRR